ncbi:MAG: J domain-containing protein [Xanthobacteraceae bacterium]
MSGGLVGDILSFAPSATVLTALAGMVPVWLVLYLHCRSRARRSEPGFALGRLESIELERAVLLYTRAVQRRREINAHRPRPSRGWRAWYRRRVAFRKSYGQELDELERYARDLRATIIRLKGRPLRRYRSWIRVVSSGSALGHALGSYVIVLALLAAACSYLQPSDWGPGAHAELDTLLLWQRLEGRLLLANWMAGGFAGAAAPLLYAIRRTQLWRLHAPQIRALKAYAALDPDTLIAQRQADGTDEASDTGEAAQERPEAPLAASTWFEVLGVPPSASFEEVREAYKRLIKQNHPDRVQSMARPFQALAEAETKKLTMAYAEAASYFREDDPAMAAYED